MPVALGKFVSSFAGLITLALLARHLGPSPFGVIAVLRAVVLVVDQYANFNTWQAVVKYGTEAIAAERPRDVDRLIKLSTMIDFVSATAGVGVLAVLALVTPAAFGWTAEQGFLCVFYGLTLVTRVAGTSDGIFRLCDAYRAQAIVTTFSAFVLTGTVAVAVFLEASLSRCVVALVAGEVIGNIAITLAAYWVARKHGYGAWMQSSLKGARDLFPGIVRFLLATNGQLTVKKTTTELDTFVVGAMLGTVASGWFRVVKQLSGIPGRIFMPFEQVLFTELARASASSDYVGFTRLLRRFTLIVGVGSLLLWAGAAVVAEPLIRVIAGDEFVGAAPAFRWYMLAIALVVVSSTVQRAVVALGRPGLLFAFELGSLGVLVVTTLLGALHAGLVGVAAGVVLHKIVQLAWTVWLVRRVLREKQRAS